MIINYLLSTSFGIAVTDVCSIGKFGTKSRRVHDIWFGIFSLFKTVLNFDESEFNFLQSLLNVSKRQRRMPQKLSPQLSLGEMLQFYINFVS